MALTCEATSEWATHSGACLTCVREPHATGAHKTPTGVLWFTTDYHPGGMCGGFVGKRRCKKTKANAWAWYCHWHRPPERVRDVPILGGLL